MNRRTFAKAVSLSPAALSAQAPSPAAEAPYRSASPFDAGDRAQLFIDRVLVRESRGVAFTLHPGERHPRNPIVVADQPWEGWRLEIFGSVIWDAEERIYKMWYIGEPVGVFGPPPNGASGDNPTCYATSRDGIRWEKPLVGPLRTLNGKRTNALLFATHLASVHKDLADPNPDRRYKMVCWRDPTRAERGYHTMVSPDGIHWKPHSRSPICPGADVITAYFDEPRRQWVALAKIGTVIRGHNRRVFYVTTSSDFENWSAPKLAIYPDLEDDAGSFARIEEARAILDVPDDPAQMRTEFYGTGFYRAESCTLGFPWVFTINNKARYGNQEGPFELQLAVTRDLEHWERPFRIPCVPRGTNGDWECGIQQTAASAIRVGDEIRLYYCGANYTHGTPVLYRKDHPGRRGKYTSSIGLATWKLDRFVSVDGLASGAQLTTVPLVYSGERLELNAKGPVRVELLDAAGKALTQVSEPVAGDSLRHTVRWNGPGAANFKGKPVMARFHLAEAELYSFAFRKG